MHSLRPLIPILTAAGILLGGNGLQGTLIALRGAQEGFSPASIGFMGTAYFAGFLIGCLVIVRMMRAVGHIRAFSALAAMAAAATLVMAVAIDVSVWVLMRFISGFCFAGLFTVMESWLNSGVSNQDRARVLALYRIIDLGAVTGSQFLIPVVGADGFAIFAVMAIMITLSLVPVSLGDRSNPAAPEDVKLDLRRAWEISPIAAIGCIAVGVTNSAFRTMSPVYAQDIGMSVTDVATFVSVSIIGGALIQYPLGYASDRHDRRTVLLVTTALALAAALALFLFAGSGLLLNFALVFVFGSFAMPLFSLSAAHANDRAAKNEYVMLNAALMLFYSFGAIGGPFAAAAVMEWFGPHALFLFSAVVYAVFLALILWRMRARAPAPSAQRGRFTALLRTSTIFARLAQRNGSKDTPDRKGDK
ncbi:MFS transporter [Mesorhizobium microcysteis]|jgi:MFS family permease|uniref:MFS transporter n=1 Tax=Neoaquamicrobium microcysteis TaxID=2682781 RepID=A0A5D4H050_9HYPH|nr:MFS transporter [Mesorhizobium microcysteis]TYR32865.1 MFS transporter [Mesorhizobium microcysteis]